MIPLHRLYLLVGVALTTDVTSDAFAFAPLRAPPATILRHSQSRLLSAVDSEDQDACVSAQRYGDKDYEYIPINPGARPKFQTNLGSPFPPDVPSGVRGEAVRAALRSGRCLLWDFCQTPLSQGLLHVEGKGTMDFLNNKFSQTFGPDGCYKMGCLLNAKGRLVDTVGVATINSSEAYMLTSPGHLSTPLFERLDPLIFPMDQVKLTNCEDARILTVGSSRLKDVRTCFKDYVLPTLKQLGQNDLVDYWRFPSPGQIRRYTLKDGSPVLVFPTPSVLPNYMAFGYTVAFLTNDDSMLAKELYRSLLSEDNPEGPVELGAREFESLRIEGGVPAFGREFSIPEDDEHEKRRVTPASPLELHIGQEMIDTEKGCYLGQEGIASIMKNPRGPPRLLYSVVFEDDVNMYQYETEGDGMENPTRLPVVGDELFVLGSNEKISLGKITSVGEPGGTGDTNTVGLCLIRRADSVLSRMKAMDLEISPPMNTGSDDDMEEDEWDGSGPQNMKSPKTIPKTPMDPLDGLEVIVGGTYTFGQLKSVPSRQGLPPGLNMFEDMISYDDIVGEASKMQSAKTGAFRRRETGYLREEANAKQMSEEGEYPWDVLENDPNAKVRIESKSTMIEVGRVEREDDQDQEELKKQIEQAEAEAAAAEAEAKRKAEKMEMLRKRAEAAMAKRKAKKKDS